MAKSSSNLAAMSVDALLKLRDEIGGVLGRKVGELRRQLSQLTGASGPGAKNGRRKKAHALKGAKVPPKYRDPKTGATWAGRGAKPRWMQAYIKDGRAPEEFSVAGAGSSGKPGRKKTGAKRGRKAKAAAA
jgi:DNA-binding protein H-NS